ncbi:MULTISPECIES: hypothetical protein [Moorena]|uniref:hypothetical protein n=1 Tax=Moorena TaxID=1155738 RepID=UPI0010542986|nr:MULTISPECIES: hypothetical protein [Moorena]NEP32227.1 hypothetical protein [Moorena sp. SIO3B2]NEP66180.1 hypothetical protein [Moorena sp. SIO3A5]NEQ05057.1 hypothetical protein [Moorena sp. SIO4E2]
MLYQNWRSPKTNRTPKTLGTQERLAYGHATRVTRSQSVAVGLSFRAYAIGLRPRYAMKLRFRAYAIAL